MPRAKQDRHSIRYAPIFTPLGQLYVACRGRTICYAAVAASDHAFERECARVLGVQPMRDKLLQKGLAKQVLDHLHGKRRLSSPFDLSHLTPFQRLVLEKIREIPSGQVRSYKWVAEQIGVERAVRAVGTALARNPIPLLIPCHRVVRTDGRIGHYSAGGSSMKAKVLAFEGVDIRGLERPRTQGSRLSGSEASKVF